MLPPAATLRLYRVSALLCSALCRAAEKAVDCSRAMVTGVAKLGRACFWLGIIRALVLCISPCASRRGCPLSIRPFRSRELAARPFRSLFCGILLVSYSSTTQTAKGRRERASRQSRQDRAWGPSLLAVSLSGASPSVSSSRIDSLPERSDDDRAEEETKKKRHEQTRRSR